MSEKKIKILFFIILGIFVASRLLGVQVVYHQDELRIAAEVSQSYGWSSVSGYGHGPIMGLIYTASGWLFGADNIRLFPLIFGAINFFLLFYLTKSLFGLKEAFWSLILFAVSYYNVLASLMIDVDGQVLPFFFLLSVIAFIKWQASSYGFYRWRWLAILLLVLAAGLLTKFSFGLVIAVLGIELFLQMWAQGNERLIIKYGLGGVLFLGLVVVALMNADLVIRNYPLNDAIVHAKGYMKFFGRSYFQTTVQLVKVLFYISPLLIAPLFLLRKDDFKKLRIFLTFLLFGLTFYLVLFDFSLGALDKYFEFIIVPLSVIGGVVLAKIFGDDINFKKSLVPAVIGLIGALLFFFIQFFPHSVPPLWPKTEWVSRALTFRWNFLMPFTGGSGPAGFYVSWLYIALNWILSFSLMSWAVISLKWRKFALVIIIVTGIAYNLVFVEEYLFGKINGNVTSLVNRSVNFIKNNSDVEKVVTYNNIGGYELMKIDKYKRRLYVAPKFEPFNREEMSKFEGHYLVIDIPRIDSNSIYAKYFSSCDFLYESFSGKITARIYDCEALLEN